MVRILGRINEASEDPYHQPDLIIAATASQHGLTVVTRDTGDYKLARVPLLNPWINEPS